LVVLHGSEGWQGALNETSLGFNFSATKALVLGESLLPYEPNQGKTDDISTLTIPNCSTKFLRRCTEKLSNLKNLFH